MNPYTFLVELYHEKISTKQDPRDILSPSSLSQKSRKRHPAIKFVGGLTASKASLVVVGGILAVGCTVRALRNRRLRLIEKRNELRRESAECSRIEIGTQTDSLSDLSDMERDEIERKSRHAQLASNLRDEAVPADDFVANKLLSPKTHEAPESSQSNDAKLSRVCRNISNVTEESDDNAVMKCDCSSKNRAAAVEGRAAQMQHSCCYLSAFIALLALHKASSSERAAGVTPFSPAKPKGRMTNRNVDNVSQPGTSVAEKPQQPACRNTGEVQNPKKPQSRGTWETSHPALGNCDTRKGETNEDEANGSDLSSSELRSNPFDVQVQPSSSDKTGPGMQGRPLFKADSSSSRARPSNRELGSKSNFSSSQGGSTNHVAQNPFEQSQEVENAARSRANNKRGESRTSSVTFRPRRNGDRGGFHQRGKPRRRGNGRQNHPRRPYVDLDAPQPIASKHQHK